MRDKLQSIYVKTGTTTVLVSHDLEEAIQMASQVLLLTRRPTQVAEMVVNPMAWPRTTSVLTTPEFVSLKSHCLDVFRREAQRASSLDPFTVDQ